jgi:XTP/dITP diphosphohydrolase
MLTLTWGEGHSPRLQLHSHTMILVDSPRLIIATNNKDKVQEFRDLLHGCGWRVIAPWEAGIELDVAESGQIYAENARLKARAFSRASGLAALADDSGLEVDALNGEPGALHHVRGWDGATQDERIALLLDALRAVPAGQRSARFRAALVVALPDGRFLEEEGVCEGVIAEAPAGRGGFGYDPVFVLPREGRTMAELSAAEKNLVSHRAVAATELKPRLRALADSEL